MSNASISLLQFLSSANQQYAEQLTHELREATRVFHSLNDCIGAILQPLLNSIDQIFQEKASVKDGDFSKEVNNLARDFFKVNSEVLSSREIGDEARYRFTSAAQHLANSFMPPRNSSLEEGHFLPANLLTVYAIFNHFNEMYNDLFSDGSERSFAYRYQFLNHKKEVNDLLEHATRLDLSDSDIQSLKEIIIARVRDPCLESFLNIANDIRSFMLSKNKFAETQPSDLPLDQAVDIVDSSFPGFRQYLDKKLTELDAHDLSDNILRIGAQLIISLNRDDLETSFNAFSNLVSRSSDSTTLDVDLSEISKLFARKPQPSASLVKNSLLNLISQRYLKDIFSDDYGEDRIGGGFAYFGKETRKKEVDLYRLNSPHYSSDSYPSEAELRLRLYQEAPWLRSGMLQAFNTHNGFHSLEFDAKGRKGKLPLLLRFAKDFSVKTPKLIHGDNREAFPGRGLTIEGINLKDIFQIGSDVELKYYFSNFQQQLTFKAFSLAASTQFSFMRGAIVLSNPYLKLPNNDGEDIPYSYLVYNDHFRGGSIAAGLLVPTESIQTNIENSSYLFDEDLVGKVPADVEDVNGYDFHVSHLAQNAKQLNAKIYDITNQQNAISPHVNIVSVNENLETSFNDVATTNLVYGSGFKPYQDLLKLFRLGYAEYKQTERVASDSGEEQDLMVNEILDIHTRAQNGEIKRDDCPIFLLQDVLDWMNPNIRPVEIDTYDLSLKLDKQDAGKVSPKELQNFWESRVIPILYDTDTDASTGEQILVSRYVEPRLVNRKTLKEGVSYDIAT